MKLRPENHFNNCAQFLLIPKGALKVGTHFYFLGSICRLNEGNRRDSSIKAYQPLIV